MTLYFYCSTHPTDKVVQLTVISNGKIKQDGWPSCKEQPFWKYSSYYWNLPIQSGKIILLEEDEPPLIQHS